MVGTFFFFFLWLSISYVPCQGDDPKDISEVLWSHIKSSVQHLPSRVDVGNLSVRDVVMPRAQLGDLKSIRLVGRAWFWRKFIWFSVFGDIKLDNMYLTSPRFTINGRNHTGRIEIGDNALHFHWEAVDYFKCSILRERLDWLPLRKFSLREGRTTAELIFSDDEVFKLKNSLLSGDFANRIRDVLLPCLHPSNPTSQNGEDREDFDGKASVRVQQI